jgi:hypothetical protein
MKSTKTTCFQTIPKRTKQFRLALAVALAASSSIAVATSAQAQTGGPTDVSATTRVSQAADLRALTEAIASASCRVNAGFDVETSQAELSIFRKQFSSTIDALINGNELLGMPGAETRARTITALNETQDLWAPIEAASGNFAAGTGSAEDAAIIGDNHKALSDQTDALAAIVAGQYSDLLQRDATVINFAIGQRQHAYALALKLCELAAGSANADTLEDLQTSTDQFQQIFLALRDGFPAAGVNPPPTPEISERLVATYARWQAERLVFDAALAGDTPSAESVKKAAELSKELSAEMQEIIALYRAAAG